MSCVRKLLPVLAAVGILCMPLLAAPQLSLHTPTISAPLAHVPAGHFPPALPLAPMGFAMAIRIKDTATLAQKFVQRAGQASQDYASGVQAAGQDWQQKTLDAESSYEQGVTASIADKRFSKGVQEAGAAKYTQNATQLGPQRFQTGVANAAGAWAKGVQPHLDAMRSADFGPRGPKGSPQNQQRANAAATLNRAIKLRK